MSLGLGIGTFVNAGELCLKVFERCKASLGGHAEISREVSLLFYVIKQTEEMIYHHMLTPKQRGKLVVLQKAIEHVLMDLERLLVKYETLGSRAPRIFDRMDVETKVQNDMRLRLIATVSMLDTFNKASSHANFERKLGFLIYEIRAGKREVSVAPIRTVDSTACDDQETWDVLREELEDMDVSPFDIAEKRDFIIAWYQNAVANGLLEEQARLDADEKNTPIDGNLGDYDQVIGEKNDCSVAKIESMYNPSAMDVHRIEARKKDRRGIALGSRIASFMDRCCNPRKLARRNV